MYLGRALTSTSLVIRADNTAMLASTSGTHLTCSRRCLHEESSRWSCICQLPGRALPLGQNLVLGRCTLQVDEWSALDFAELGRH